MSDLRDFTGKNRKFTGTDSILTPKGTEAQRVNTESGQLRFNTDTNLMEYYNGTEWKPIDSPPTVTSITPTEVDSADGSTTSFSITGGNFQAGAVVKFVGNDGTTITAGTVTVNSTSSITAVESSSSFASAKEPYDVTVTNSSGLSAELADQINVDTAPSWSTASGTIATVDEGAAVSTSVTATDTDGDTITYSETTSTLTTAGLSLDSANGAITGTAATVSSDTTYNFTVRATANSKTADRAFSIVIEDVPTIRTADITWEIRARDHSYSNAASIADGTSLTLSSNTASGLSAEVEYGDVDFYTNTNAPDGKAFYIDGSGCLEINPSNATNANTYFNNPTSQSTAIWFYWPSDSSRQVLISRYSGSTSVYQWNQIVDPGREFHYNSSGVISGASGDINVTMFNTSTWHLMHKVYNVSDGIARWYIDGSQVATRTWGTDSGNGLSGYSNNTTAYTIGSRTDNYETFVGYVGEARHYNIALTASEISDEWSATASSYGRTP